MKKIPTIFERDWGGDRSRVLDKPNPSCAWVFAGEGTATRKLDGTSCLVKDGKLFKRRELRVHEVPPTDFESVGFDEETGKTVGWVPVTNDPSDKYHREAFRSDLSDGTYELVGPKVQGNPERFEKHTLVKHDTLSVEMGMKNVPRDFNGLSMWLLDKDWEGIVFHHPDGRMGKIKKRDFGMKRKLQ